MLVLDARQQRGGVPMSCWFARICRIVSGITGLAVLSDRMRGRHTDVDREEVKGKRRKQIYW